MARRASRERSDAAGRADDDVIQLYTSGTTGHPKGVQLTNANYLAIFKIGADMGLATYDARRCRA